MTKQEYYNEAVRLNAEINKYRDNNGNVIDYDGFFKVIEKALALTETVKKLYGKDEEMFILYTATH